MNTGGPCFINEESKCPDENCWFVPDPDRNDDIESSLMAIPLYDPTDYFCEDPYISLTRDHQPELPNRQNAMCSNLCTWHTP